MPDLKKYWQEVRVIEKTLPEFVWLMSLDNPRRGQVGGCLAEVTASIAAQLLHAKSHRLATEEEIHLHKQREAQIQRVAIHDKLRRQGVTVVPLSRE
jgi:hypothetical protein